ncbi:MAG: hypothetical protein ACHQIL_13430 [Steroidobacterales bacterium]
MIAKTLRTSRLLYFVIGTLAVSVLALIQTYLSRWPGRGRLYYPIFDRLFTYTDNRGAAVEILVVLLACAVPAIRRAGARLAVAMGANPGWTAGATFVVVALGARFAYHATPFSMDESVQVSQAYAFAGGSLSWIVPPDLLDRMIPIGFRNYFYIVNQTTGQTASAYWPGFAALLTPFVWADVPWLLNPALTAASLLLIHAICVRLLGDKDAGGWAMLFALGSVQFTINGMSYYSMPAHLALNLLYAWLLLDGRPSHALLAGLVGGFALVLHNPVPHVLFAIPWLIWLLRDPRRWGALVAAAVGYIPIGLVVGFVWPLYLGSFGPTPAAATAHSDVGTLWLMIYTKLTSVIALPDFPMVCARLYATWKIWIWSVPGLLLLAIQGARVVRGPILLFGASAAVTYAFYWLVPLDQGHGWGYRYFHSAWAALPLLGAAFIVTQPLANEDGFAWRQWAGGFAVASLVLSTTLQAWQVDATIGEHVGQRISVPDRGRWILFVTPQRGLYTWDMIQNFPGDRQKLTLMSFGAASDAALVASRYPQAQRMILDRRGSLWSLPSGQQP